MTSLSTTKVKTIMRTSDGVDLVGKDAIFVTAKAAVIF